jgi:hypothetical protein
MASLLRYNDERSCRKLKPRESLRGVVAEAKADAGALTVHGVMGAMAFGTSVSNAEASWDVSLDHAPVAATSMTSGRTTREHGSARVAPPDDPGDNVTSCKVGAAPAVSRTKRGIRVLARPFFSHHAPSRCMFSPTMSMRSPLTSWLPRPEEDHRADGGVGTSGRIAA